MGLELQVTIWAYDRDWVSFGQTIYLRYRLINKSGFAIDSMYAGMFSDIDIENYADDFVGCDSALSLGYGYNGVADQICYGEYNGSPHAAGYVILQGPVVPSQGDTATIGFRYVPDCKNLAMTSFYYNGSGSVWPSPLLGNYDGTLMVYNLLKGYHATPDAVPFPFVAGSGPDSGKTTKYPLNGDPLTGQGDVDGKGKNLQPGDRRIVVCTGPFSMQPGEMQEIVFALIGAEGDASLSNVAAITLLKHYAMMVHEIYKDIEDIPAKEPPEPPVNPVPDANMFILGDNYPNPFNSTTTIRFMLYNEMEVRLSIYNTRGQKVADLFSGKLDKGEHFIHWDGRNLNGFMLPSGLYFVRMQSGAIIQTRKIILLR